MKKLYYSIGEVSEITSIETHVLRYWETIFNDLSPRKNKAGNRTYKEEDLIFILRLKDLIQNKKYSTAGAKKIIEDGAPESDVSMEQVPLALQKDLNEVKVFLNKLLQKI